MITRKPLRTRSRKCGDLYKFKSRQTFKQDAFPTTKDILERLFCEPNWRQRIAATNVAEELVCIWRHCNVYSISIPGVIPQIEKLFKNFSRNSLGA